MVVTHEYDIMHANVWYIDSKIYLIIIFIYLLDSMGVLWYHFVLIQFLASFILSDFQRVGR